MTLKAQQRESDAESLGEHSADSQIREQAAFPFNNELIYIFKGILDPFRMINLIKRIYIICQLKTIPLFQNFISSLSFVFCITFYKKYEKVHFRIHGLFLLTSQNIAPVLIFTNSLELSF